jgi:hypothetical protein
MSKKSKRQPTKREMDIFRAGMVTGASIIAPMRTLEEINKIVDDHLVTIALVEIIEGRA